MTAPIALFAYHRPDHLARVLQALRANPEARESDLVAYSDGPKHPGHEAGVEAVRVQLRELDGFRSLRVVERDRNMGLAKSIIAGVSELVEAHGEVVVVEDDLVVSPDFLRYMNQGLERYRHEENVASIHGYRYPLASTSTSSFFIRGADCWGWATWRRAWKVFEPDSRVLLARLRHRKLERHFDFDGTYGYVRMLQDQIEGRVDSWAIRWYASAFLADMVTLYPRESLVENIGHDGSGSHCDPSDRYRVEIASSGELRWPEKVEEDQAMRREFARYFRSIQGKSSLRSRIGGALRALLGRLRHR